MNFRLPVDKEDWEGIDRETDDKVWVEFSGDTAVMMSKIISKGIMVHAADKLAEVTEGLGDSDNGEKGG
jgi:hypothetical protein